MLDWIRQAKQALRQEGMCILVTIAEAKGSSPRGAGTKMIVSDKYIWGTIGGGKLEWMVTENSRDMLRNGESYPTLTNVPLGPKLGQCCGGHVKIICDPLTSADLNVLDQISNQVAGRNSTLVAYEFDANRKGRRWIGSEYWQSPLPTLPPQIKDLALARVSEIPYFRCNPNGQQFYMELLTDRRPVLWLYGAGHVGQVIVDCAKHLPIKMVWVDSRVDIFPRSLPINTRTVSARSPELTVNDAPVGANYLVMTHDHCADYEICRLVLKRNDFNSLGLIGSATKRNRFEKRWISEGISPHTIERLSCPIGVPSIAGKTPGEIAISYLAELLSASAVAQSCLDGSTVLGYSSQSLASCTQ